MKFFKILFISVFLIIFVSCSHKPDKNERKRAFKNYDTITILYFAEALEEYKKVIDLVKAEHAIYEQLLARAYEAQDVYDEIVEKEKARSQILSEVQTEIAALEELIQSEDWPEEVHDKLQALKGGLESIQEIIERTETPADETETLVNEEDPSTGEMIPEDEASGDEAVPAGEPGAEVVPEDEVSGAEVVPADGASGDEAVPADEVSGAEAVPADEVSGAEAAPEDAGVEAVPEDEVSGAEAAPEDADGVQGNGEEVPHVDILIEQKIVVE